VPAGVFNLIQGDGATVGAALSSHPEVDMVSFTGSTRAGIEIARSAAPSVKRVAQELGGKSPNILLDDADFATAVSGGVQGMMLNSGQSCNAPSRMLVPQSRHDEAVAIATATVAALKVGDPSAADSIIGPVVSEAQYERIQRLIRIGLGEGATLACGGPGRPAGLERGYYVQPTVFANVRNDMTIAREEIFGPVLCIIPYGSEDEAIAIANDTPYGLSSYVSGSDAARVQRVAARLRAGMVHVNGAGVDFNAPFGGYKQSGNGREWGEFGLHDFLEVKAVMHPA
jgi:aldehyde dehydrogenase (NAD+)